MSYELSCRIIVEKDDVDALLVDDLDGNEEWIPLSQIERITRLRDGNAIIAMTDWIARKKGWL